MVGFNSWILAQEEPIQENQEAPIEKHYSLLYKKSMIPKPDSVKYIETYLTLYDGFTYDLRSYRNFTLAANYINFFPRHSFAAELSLPYIGQSYEVFETRATQLATSIKYVSKNYLQRKYKNYHFQATWRYFLKQSSKPYNFYAYKNAPTPNDSVPIVTGEKQTRFYLRGGIGYQISPNFFRLNFTQDPESPFNEASSGFLLHKNRMVTLFVGFERQKEHYTSTSINRIKFHNYRQTKKFYADFIFQPFCTLGKLEILDSNTVLVPDENQISNTQPMDKSAKKYIKKNNVDSQLFGIRVGYSFNNILNSPLSVGFESGILTGIDRRNSPFGSLYSKIRLNFDVRLSKPLRTDGITW